MNTDYNKPDYAFEDAMCVMSETKDWLRRNNPKLHGELSGLSIYESILKVCEKYGIEPVGIDDIVVKEQPRVLRELIRITGKT